MQLRIHHFFDIIRDFGKGKPIVPHPYFHSYHLVAEEIRNNPCLPIKLVLSCDAICKGCLQISDNHCLDTISHRRDFTLKEDFNNFIDLRIMEVCKLSCERIYTPLELCQSGEDYLKNAEYIYEGNDAAHTVQRKLLVNRGLDYYLNLHA